MFSRILLIFTLLLVLAETASAQVIANFSSNFTEGCGSIQVQFINNSTGNGTLSYSWVFGNGNTSTLANPLATYSTPGVYTVTLTVTNGTDTDVQVKPGYITVYAEPTSAFSSLSVLEGCPPLAIDFVNESTEGDGAITQWTWSYGDGSPQGTQENPNHVYLNPGIFDVSLNITDANGCTDYLEIPSFVTVTEVPEAIIGASDTVSCYPPLQVNFSNNSTGAGALSHIWYFGTDSTTTVDNPVYNYTDEGVYTVSLVVTDGTGCTDSVSVPIEITHVSAEFSIIGGDTVCPGDMISLQNQSVGASFASWDFGDGSAGSTDYDAQHSWAIPGTYSIQLIASSDTACVDTVIHTIVVQEVTAAFTADPIIGCQVPLDVTFTDQSTNADSWYWTFGDTPTTGESTDQNPVYSYQSDGTHTVILQVTSQYGCTDNASANILIELPVADFEIDGDLEGCAREITFNDMSSSYDTIVSWEWDFGDNDPAGTSTEQNPTYLFEYNDFMHQNQGECTVTLTITTQSGCTAIFTDDILVGIPPVTQFYLFSDENEEPYFDTIFHTCPHYHTVPGQDTVACPNCQYQPYYTCAWPDTIYFYDSSFVYYNGIYYSRDSLIDEWQWDFGELAGSSGEEDPMYSYLDADSVGFMDVELITGYNKCYDTLKMEEMIYVLGPIVHGTPIINCDSAYTWDFSIELISGTNFYWMVKEYDPSGMGDTVYMDSIVYASDTTLFDTISYTFPSNTDYYVVFWAYNDSTCCYPENYYYNTDNNFVDTLEHKDSCMYYDSVLVNVRDLQIAFAFDTMVCAGKNYIYNGTISQDAVSYYWNFGDGASSTFPLLNHAYPWLDTIYDNYNISLTVADANGCSKDSTVLIHSYQVFADFILDSLDRCVPFDATFTDSSWAALPLDYWNWNFGDTFSDTGETVVHTYDTNGVFDVTLTIRDTLGCIDNQTYNDIIITSIPFADFDILDGTLCVGDTAFFIDSSVTTLSNGLLSYTWVFGDGDTSNMSNPYHIYTDTGRYSVRLIIEEYLGCEDDTTIEYIVDVQAADASFHASNTYTDCMPLYVGFYSDYDVNYIQNWEWNFGEGNVISHLPDSAFYEYSSPGNFIVSLNIQTTYGCRDTVVLSDTIKIGGPWAEFSSTPDSICIGDEIVFEITDSSSLAYFSWDFGDGGGGTGSPTSHAYDQTGWITTYLWVYSDVTMTCWDNIKDSVYVYEVEAMFGRGPTDADSIGCEPVTVDFTDMSQGTNLVYYWTFEDGTSSDQANPQHVFANDGFYDVQLNILDMNLGCDDSITKRIYVFDTPEISVMDDTLVCQGDLIQLWGSYEDSVHWSPETGLDDPFIQTPSITMDSTVLFTYEVFSANRCNNTAEVEVSVHAELDIDHSADTSIYIGEQIQIFVSGDQTGISIHWEPPVGLSCTDCADPVARPLQSTEYSVTVTDTLGCHPQVGHVYIEVIEEYKVDVPRAFTPNGDGVNDFVMLKGIGIKELIDFSIYNRWGEKVFSTDELENQGWDGTINGIPQNMDTYAYVGIVRYYDSHEETVKGNINLLR